MHDAIGKSYDPVVYEVGREKIAEYARVVGEDAAIHFEREAAHSAGFRDVVAPPMFAVVYCSAAIGAALFDGELGIDFDRLLHGGQEFSWGEPVCSGDVITTATTFVEHDEKMGNDFFTFETVSQNEQGDEVCRGRWMNIVRSA